MRCRRTLLLRGSKVFRISGSGSLTLGGCQGFLFARYCRESQGSSRCRRSPESDSKAGAAGLKHLGAAGLKTSSDENCASAAPKLVLGTLGTRVITSVVFASLTGAAGTKQGVARKTHMCCSRFTNRCRRHEARTPPHSKKTDE